MSIQTDDMIRTGEVTLELFDENGNLKQRQVVPNLITDVGDAYYAAKCIVGIGPANPSAPTAVTGMKLGTGTTAAAKSGGGAALVNYLTGSNVAFASGYPQVANLGGGLGVNDVYQVTFGPGVGTGSPTEIVIVTDSATNGASLASATIARSVFAAIPKASGDTLAATWAHKNLGG